MSAPILTLPVEIVHLIIQHLPQQPSTFSYDYVRQFKDRDKNTHFPLLRNTFHFQTFELALSPKTCVGCVDCISCVETANEWNRNDEYSITRGEFYATDLLNLASTCRRLRHLVARFVFNNVKLELGSQNSGSFKLQSKHKPSRLRLGKINSTDPFNPYKLTIEFGSSTIFNYVTQFTIHATPINYNNSITNYEFYSSNTGSIAHQLTWYQLIHPTYIPNLQHCKVVFPFNTTQTYWNSLISTQFDVGVAKYKSQISIDLLLSHTTLAEIHNVDNLHNRGNKNNTFLQHVKALELYLYISCPKIEAAIQILSQMKNLRDLTLLAMVIDSQATSAQQQTQQGQRLENRSRLLMDVLENDLQKLESLAVRGVPFSQSTVYISIPKSLKSLNCLSMNLALCGSEKSGDDNQNENVDEKQKGNQDKTTAKEKRINTSRIYPNIEELCLLNFQLDDMYTFPNLKALCVIDSHLDTNEFSRFLDRHPHIERAFFMSIQAQNLELVLQKLVCLQKLHVGCITSKLVETSLSYPSCPREAKKSEKKTRTQKSRLHVENVENHDKKGEEKKSKTGVYRLPCPDLPSPSGYLFATTVFTDQHEPIDSIGSSGHAYSNNQDMNDQNVLDQATLDQLLQLQQTSIIYKSYNVDHFLSRLMTYPCISTLHTLYLPLSKSEVSLYTLVQLAKQTKANHGNKTKCALTNLYFIESNDWAVCHEFSSNAILKDYLDIQHKLNQNNNKTKTKSETETETETKTAEIALPYIFSSAERVWHSPKQIFLSRLKFLPYDYLFEAMSLQNPPNFCYKCDLVLLTNVEFY